MNLDNKKILVAEDEYFNFRYIERILRDTHVNLVWARNGEEAVSCYANDHSIELILMDIRMPGISGIDAFRQIRSVDKSVPVIAQTAYSFADNEEDLLDAGFSEYISKPIQREELITKIERLLQKNPAA
jgi:two-component system, cell cycle response regulator DivK